MNTHDPIKELVIAGFIFALVLLAVGALFSMGVPSIWN